MSESQILNEFHTLPDELKKEVGDFISFLKTQSRKPKAAELRERKFGALKGKIKMAYDFDAPLDEFKEYME